MRLWWSFYTLSQKFIVSTGSSDLSDDPLQTPMHLNMAWLCGKERIPRNASKQMQEWNRDSVCMWVSVTNQTEHAPHEADLGNE